MAPHRARGEHHDRHLVRRAGEPAEPGHGHRPDGVLELRGDHRITRYTGEGSEEVFQLDVTAADPHLIPMQRWAEVVRDAVRNREAPPDAATLEDGLACARVMDWIRRRPQA